MSLRMRLALLSGLLIATILAQGILGELNSLKTQAQVEQLVLKTLPSVQNMGLADMMHDGLRANALAAILASGSKDQSEIDGIRKEAEEFRANIVSYIQKVEESLNDAKVKGLIEEARPAVKAYTDEQKKVVDFALDGRFKEALSSLPAMNKSYEELEERLGALGDLIVEQAELAGKATLESSKKAADLILWVTAIGTILGIVFSILFIASLYKTLSQIVAQVDAENEGLNETAGGLSTQSTQLASSATEQASAIQETAASLDEIGAMVRKTDENSKNLERTTADSQRSIEEGQAAVTQLFQAVETIKQSNTRILEAIETGNQQVSDIVNVISEIGEKTKVINDIVFQTKLLSFNASVEAARAGEQGKGFAVVAEEVGNLAQMSGNAAKEISDMLSSSLEKVSQIIESNKKQVSGIVAEGKETLDASTEVARKAEGALGEIVASTSSVSQLVAEITTAIQEQNQGLNEITKAIQILNQATEENSKVSNSVSTSSQSLLQQANTLEGILARMKSYVAGSKNESALMATVHEQKPETVKKAA